MATVLRPRRGQQAVDTLHAVFEGQGWQVDKDSTKRSPVGQLRIKRDARQFEVEIKAPPEGRTDRVLPLLAQAILEARTHASDSPGTDPLAVIYLDDASEALLSQITQFVNKHADDTAIGLVTRSGLRYFRDPGHELEALNAQASVSPRPRAHSVATPVNLFSDLNQWMLKVLLAPDLPAELLNAPREPLRTGAELAQAAGVSTMSASRLLQQLKLEGHLDESARTLSLVRREELLRRWQAATMKSPIQTPMRFLLKTPADLQLRRLLTADPKHVCWGLFSAAHALGFGHVGGLAPIVCVPTLALLEGPRWRSLTPASPESSDLLVREANAPKSTFRSAVMRDGAACTDVIQTWLDVFSHPTRGEEQAALIHERVLRPHLLRHS